METIPMRCDVTIDEKLYAAYPDIRLGLLRYHAVVRDPDARFWSHMDENVLPRVRAAIEGKAWSEIPGVRGSRLAYKAFGRDPGRYRVSSEALLRRVKRGDELYHVNSVVDVNNLVSVKSGLSAGSYDLDKISGGIVFRKAGQGEGYTGIGKGFLDMENMLVLADDNGIFGSSMSDSTRTMVTGSAKDILTVVYCFEHAIDLEGALVTAKQALTDFASASDIDMWIRGGPVC